MYRPKWGFAPFTKNFQLFALFPKLYKDVLKLNINVIEFCIKLDDLIVKFL